MPDGTSSTVLDFVPRGPSYLVRKVKKWVFLPFLEKFDSTEGTKRGPKASRGA